MRYVSLWPDRMFSNCCLFSLNRAAAYFNIDGDGSADGTLVPGG